MKKYITYIKELFDTNNYKWIKKGSQNIAKFKLIDEYYIHFDSIGYNAFIIYFYYIDLEGNRIFDIINVDNRSYKVLSNVKNCIEDFIKNNKVDFIGYSSYDNERDSLYMLLLNNIKRKNDITSSKNIRRKKYYFLYDSSINLESHLYIEKFMLNDDKIKKHK